MPVESNSGTNAIGNILLLEHRNFLTENYLVLRLFIVEKFIIKIITKFYQYAQ